MRNRDQRLAPLAQSLAVQIDGAVFRDDPVHVAACGHHTGSRRDLGANARHGAALSRGRERDDRLAAARERRAADEVHLPADAGVNAMPE